MVHRFNLVLEYLVTWLRLVLGGFLVVGGCAVQLPSSDSILWWKVYWHIVFDVGCVVLIVHDDLASFEFSANIHIVGMLFYSCARLVSGRFGYLLFRILVAISEMSFHVTESLFVCECVAGTLLTVQM